jgi:hypothetical protein
MIQRLSRFQCDISPTEGKVTLQAYWCDVVTDPGSGAIVAGPLILGIDKTYPSVETANSAAIANPDWEVIAEQFQSEPFSAIAALLQAVKDAQTIPTLEKLGISLPQPSTS